MNIPKLSVMIPAYNAGCYLEAAINSVLDQSFKDLELIIVDNASTDDTDEVVGRFEDERLKYYKNDVNLGSRGNLNRCIELASGEYLHHLCADDVLLPGILEKQAAILDKYENVGLVTCDMYVTDSGLENRKRANFYPGFEKGKRVVNACCMHFGNWVGGPSNVMFRKSAAQGLKYDERLRWISDLSFFCGILENWDYCNVDEPGYLYRRHGSSETESLSKSGIHKKEELEFCLSKVGFHLCHLKYLGDKVGLPCKLKLLKHIFDARNLKLIFKLVHNLICGKNYKAILLSEYFGASICNNIAYSKSNGIINIGEGTSINDFTVIRIENGPEANLETSSLLIGENTYIGEHNNIRAAGGVIRIGNNVLISQMVTIVASNHGTDLNSNIMDQKWIRNIVTIEDDVWIGAGSVILPGATVSKGSIIAANSVVKGFVEPNSIMAGTPAKKVKSRG